MIRGSGLEVNGSGFRAWGLEFGPTGESKFLSSLLTT